MLTRGALIFGLLLGGCSGSSDDSGSETTGTSAATDGTTGTTGTSGSTGATSDATSSATGASTSSSSAATTATSSTGGSTGGTDTGSIGSPGCRATESLADGEHTFMLDGYDRRYILRLPNGYSTDKAWPLIFALHGNGGSTDEWDQVGGNQDIRAAFGDDAIIVVAEAIGNAWRDYNADPETWPAGIELELAYFDAIYQDALAKLCIDEDNVFSMGFSGGGSFSGVLGCRREFIRAIAVGGSVIYFDENDCPFTPAAWITIGDGELTPGREAYRDFFRDKAGCAATTTPGMPDGCVNYEMCGADDPVIFCAHPAGHVWPSIGTDATKAFFESFYAGG